MRLLVTCVYQYIGCVLVPRLVSKEYGIVGFDSAFSRVGWLTRLRQLKQSIDTAQIDKAFYWSS